MVQNHRARKNSNKETKSRERKKDSFHSGEFQIVYNARGANMQGAQGGE
jgi:hypothetical protein